MKILLGIFFLGLVLLLISGCLEKEEDAVFNEAEKYFATGRFNQARMLYLEYLDKNEYGTKRYAAWNRLLSLRMDVFRDLYGALDILKTMQMEYHQDQDKLWVISSRSAEVYYRLGKPRESLRAWNTSIMLAPTVRDKKQSSLKYAGVAISLGEFREAREILMEFKDCSGDIDADLCSRIHYTRGKSYYLEGFLDQAEISLARALSIDAGNDYLAMAGILQAEVLLERNESGLAGEILKKIKEIHPNPEAVNARLKYLSIQD